MSTLRIFAKFISLMDPWTNERGNILKRRPRKIMFFTYKLISMHVNCMKELKTTWHAEIDRNIVTSLSVKPNCGTALQRHQLWKKESYIISSRQHSNFVKSQGKSNSHACEKACLLFSFITHAIVQILTDSSIRPDYRKTSKVVKVKIILTFLKYMHAYNLCHNFIFSIFPTKSCGSYIAFCWICDLETSLIAGSTIAGTILGEKQKD